MSLFHRGVQVATQPGQPNAAADYASTIYVWNPFAGAGGATPIGPLPPVMTL